MHAFVTSKNVKWCHLFGPPCILRRAFTASRSASALFLHCCYLWPRLGHCLWLAHEYAWRVDARQRASARSEKARCFSVTLIIKFYASVLPKRACSKQVLVRIRQVVVEIYRV